MLGYIDQI